MNPNQKRKTHIFFRMFVWSGALSAGFLFLGNGCGKFDTQFVPGTGMAQSLSSSEILVIPGAKTVGTVYAKQVVENMISCTGVGAQSPTTKSVVEDRRSSISEFGYANQVSAPMLMAISSIAGEVCRDLIEVESAKPSTQRFIFNDFDFSSSASRLPSSTEVGVTAERLALSCWQRGLDEEERQILETSVAESFSTSPGNSIEVRNMALYLCTSFLTTLAGIEL